MERRTAIATAAAVVMGLTSGVVAVGANVGILGFSGPTSAARPKPAAAQAASTPAGERESRDQGRERAPADATQSTRTERDD